MNDERDPHLDAALIDTFDRRDRAVGMVTGDLTDVVDRARRRRTKRRVLTGVASVALLAAGTGGLFAIAQREDAPARSSAATPTTLPAADGAWFVCSGAMPQDDGSTLYDWCELESPYGNPAWSCSAPLADSAVDDDRVRFESCTAVGEAYPVEMCAPPTTVPVTIAWPSVPAPIAITCPADTTMPPWPPPTAPATTPLPCVPPTVVPMTAVAPTTPVAPTAPLATTTTTWVGYVCAAPSDPPPSVPGTLPAPTAAPTPTTEFGPVESPRTVAIGDSVMLGAADVLTQRGWTVVATQTLQMHDAIEMIEEMAAAGVFADTETVILHVGTNGTFSAEQLDTLLEPLGEVRNVLLYTIRADRSWTEPNNALLRAADQPGDNIAVIDWEVRSQECTDDCFAGDGIHLNANGKQFYADLARDWSDATQ